MIGSKRVTIKDLLEEIKHLKVKFDEVYGFKKQIANLENELSNLKIQNKNDLEMKQLDKEIQCTKCPKKFCTKNDLIRHEKSNMIKQHMLNVSLVKKNS